MKFPGFLILILLTCFGSYAQNRESLYWTRYAGQLSFNHWEISTSLEDRVAFHKGERRNLLANVVTSRKFNDHVKAGLGFAHFTTYDEEKNGLSIPELRPFQQLVISHEKGKFSFDHRFRTEQRFRQDTIGMQRLDSYTYTFRARYRLQVSYSIYKKSDERGHFAFQMKDEVFLSAGNILENFDQNRLYGGILYQMYDSVAFEIGYMWVNRNQIGDPDENADLVRITLRHNIDFEK